MYGFVGFGVTCGKVGFYRLLRSEWYKENQKQADTFIHDFHTERFMRVLVIPSSRCKQMRYSSFGPSVIHNCKDLPVLNPLELQFLQQMISIASAPPNASNQYSPRRPNWWFFASNAVVVRRIEIVNSVSQQEKLHEALRLYFYTDLSRVICEFCEFGTMQEALLWNQNQDVSTTRVLNNRIFGTQTGINVLPGQWVVINAENEIELYDNLPTFTDNMVMFCQQFTGNVGSTFSSQVIP